MKSYMENSRHKKRSRLKGESLTPALKGQAEHLDRRAIKPWTLEEEHQKGVVSKEMQKGKCGERRTNKNYHMNAKGQEGVG